MRHRSVLIAGVVGVALAALIAVFAFSPKGETDDDSRGSPLIGQLAPPLSGTTTSGEAFDIDKHRGQWVLVNFFASWCPPCVAEQPELVKFAADNAGSVQLVSVAFDDTTENVEQFFAERGGDWPVLAEETGAAAIDYGVVKLPESYLVDPSGTVVEKLIGGVRAADVQELVESRGSGS